MDSHPDKIFRDKLGASHRPAPPAAWKRIERNIARPKAYYKWMGIAAGILVVIVSGYLVWPLRLTLSDHQITNSVQKKIPNESEITYNDQKETLSDREIIQYDQKKMLSDRNVQQIEIINQEKEAIVAIEDPVQPSQEANRKISVPPTTINETQEFDVDNKIDLPETDVVESITQIPVPEDKPAVILATEAPTQDKKVSRTIVYHIEDVNARFFREKVTTTEPVVNPAKDLRQNTSFVYVLKNNEFGLGDLRQIKDEFLTLEFLAHNDKTDKSNNR